MDSKKKILNFFNILKCNKYKKSAFLEFIIELNEKYKLKEILNIIYKTYKDNLPFNYRIYTFEDLYQLNVIMTWCKNKYPLHP